MTFSVPTTAKCSNCLAILSWPDDVRREAKIICAQCGENCGTYGEIEDDAAAAVAAHIDALTKGRSDS